MPNTYELISSNILSASAASVTFSSIPGTYTDLVLRFSGRLDGGAGSGVAVIRLNSSALSMGTTYMYTNYSGTKAGGKDTASTTCGLGYINDGGSTANTFSNSEVYIPNYAVSGTKKQATTFPGMEYISGAFNYGFAGSISIDTTTAITSIEIDSVTGGTNFVSGCSFYLYGIKSS